MTEINKTVKMFPPMLSMYSAARYCATAPTAMNEISMPPEIITKRQPMAITP